MTGPIDSTVLWLTWRQLFARRRLYLAAAFSLAPLVIALVFRVSTKLYRSSTRLKCILSKSIIGKHESVVKKGIYQPSHVMAARMTFAQFCIFR